MNFCVKLLRLLRYKHSLNKTFFVSAEIIDFYIQGIFRVVNGHVMVILCWFMALFNPNSHMGHFYSLPPGFFLTYALTIKALFFILFSPWSFPLLSVASGDDSGSLSLLRDRAGFLLVPHVLSVQGHKKEGECSVPSASAWSDPSLWNISQCHCCFLNWQRMRGWMRRESVAKFSTSRTQVV